MRVAVPLSDPQRPGLGVDGGADAAGVLEVPLKPDRGPHCPRAGQQRK